MKIFVSILIVSFNAEKYIEKTIKSCLNQTYKNCEILLLDNASADGTLKIAKKLQVADARLKIFESQKNLGPYGGLNFLLEKAKGEYIAIQDHDDIWFPKKIEKQVEFLEKNKDFVACGTNTFYYYESKEILILNKKPSITKFVDHTSLMFRNKSFRYNNKYLLADEYFEKKTLATNGNIACLQEPMTIHRIKGDGTNLSTSRFKFSLKNIREFFSINPLSLFSCLYLLDLLVGKYLSKNITLSIRKNITQRKSRWVSMYEFKQLFPDVKI